MITRFAPSPSGLLHLGHAYSALFAYKAAKDNNGTFILRIEDIDTMRCHSEFEDAIFKDLKWLGLNWEEPVRRQSDHLEDYKDALGKLSEKNLLYPCFCTRKEIRAEIARAGTAPHGPEGHLYPGICRNLSESEQEDKIASGLPYAFRLDMDAALKTIKEPLYWIDREKGKPRATPGIMGDAVLARKDINTSYHLSVTQDDHWQDITLVTRGEDLFYATHLHRLLQALLDLNVPEYHHHKLLCDEQGNRLAKRNKSIALQNLRDIQHKSPQDVMDMMMFHV